MESKDLLQFRRKHLKVSLKKLARKELKEFIVEYELYQRLHIWYDATKQ